MFFHYFQYGSEISLTYNILKMLRKSSHLVKKYFVKKLKGFYTNIKMTFYIPLIQFILRTRHEMNCALFLIIRRVVTSFQFYFFTE